jgi:hypothetical protein
LRTFDGPPEAGFAVSRAVRRKLTEVLEDVIAAEGRAAELRRIYGDGAERVCDALIAGRARRDPEIEHLKDVRRALRWV